MGEVEYHSLGMDAVKQEELGRGRFGEFEHEDPDEHDFEGDQDEWKDDESGVY